MTTPDVAALVARVLGARLVGVETRAEPTGRVWLVLHFDNAIAARVPLANGAVELEGVPDDDDGPPVH